MEQFQRLFSIIKTLRSENGCPWDKEQTVESMVSDIIEETYEVVEAIEKKNTADLKEELGDLFFLALFVSYIAEQENRLTVNDVISSIADKLVRRHPHVFGNSNAENMDQILVNWEAIKRSEEKNSHRKTPFDGIPSNLPEIQRFNKILEKAKRSGIPTESSAPDEIQDSLKNALNGNDPANMSQFVREFLTHCYINKINLPSMIRSIGSDTISKLSK